MLAQHSALRLRQISRLPRITLHIEKLLGGIAGT